MIPRILISACLCGRACRYDGRSIPVPLCRELAGKGLALPVCPEELGGLPTPRPAMELLDRRAFDKNGRDRTEACEKGGLAALALARRHDIRLAILKERSPSCAPSMLYDGSFTGRLAPGMGLAASILRQNGVTVYSEENMPVFLLEAMLEKPGAQGPPGEFTA